MKIILILCLFGAQSISANEYTWTGKKVDLGLLHTELVAAGFQVGSTLADREGNGTIIFKNNELRSPQAVIDAHIFKTRKEKHDEKTAQVQALLLTIEAEASNPFEVAVAQLLRLILERIFGLS